MDFYLNKIVKSYELYKKLYDYKTANFLHKKFLFGKIKVLVLVFYTRNG